MRQTIIIILISIMISGTGNGQQNLEENEVLREVFADGEFFFASEDYADALLEYLKLYRRGFKENAHINYKMGICYLNIPGQKHEAIPYLQVAAAGVSKNYRESALRETHAPYDAFLYLGNAYRINNELDKAIQAYTKYKELLTKDDVLNIEYANKQIESCKNAMKFMENPVQVEEINLDRPINNSSANFRPAVSGDGKSMVYMNSLPFYDALYYSTFEDGEWSTPTNITPQVQSDGDHYVTALSFDGTKLFLARDDDFDSEIYISTLTDGVWTKSRKLSDEINTKFWESHASVSKDGNTLYFASNKNGTLGEMDIFMSVKDNEGDWGPPVNLGKTINTYLNEDAPFLTPDGKRLYFSSQGHNNMGGYDIFYSEKKKDGTWSEPVNLGYPINTTDNDLFYSPLDEYTGFMAKYHENGQGREDIYMYQFPGAPVELTAEIEEPAKAEEVITEVAQEVTQETTGSAEEITEEIVSTTEKIEEEVVEETKAPAPREITVTPILFKFDESVLNNEAKEILDKIARVMQDETAILLKAYGYTDNMGPDSYNTDLGKKRAQAVINYLGSKGIDTSRLTAVGKGATGFIAINLNQDGSDNPEGRTFNRRVELEFEDTPEHLIIIEPNIVPEKLRIQ